MVTCGFNNTTLKKGCTHDVDIDTHDVVHLYAEGVSSQEELV